MASKKMPFGKAPAKKKAAAAGKCKNCGMAKGKCKC